jgi:Ca2+-binding RTX toxin-like protein
MKLTQPATYALLAAASYADIRTDPRNQAPIPSGWTELTQYARSGSGTGTTANGGFSAKVFKGPGGEVVISFAGTEISLVGGTSDFVNGNIPLARGGASSQAYQAALLYQQVKKEQGPNITFTGHSLGGGLASVMAVWFNQPAYVFAPAPFQASADATQATSDPSYVLPNVRALLGGNIDPALANYNPTTDFAVREANVRAWAVRGEILEGLLGGFNWVEGSGISLLKNPETQLGMLDKHSIDLHVAALLSTTFDEWASKIPTALPRIFDSTLYGNKPTSDNPDFLIKLNRNEVGVQGAPANGMLTHFAADLQKVGTNSNGLNTNAQDAILSQSIEWYYWQPTSYSGKEFFTQTGNLLQYTTAQGDALPGALNKASTYVDKWLTPLLNDAGEFGGNVNYQQWNVNGGTGASSGSARDTGKTQIFVGNTGSDQFTGGDESDLLLGGQGDDNLTGGAGDDKLLGGVGDDLLDGGDGKDTIDAGAGNDTVLGGAGADDLKGGAGIDKLNGDSGDDTLDGGDGSDNLIGGAGSDKLDGNSGDDDLDGGDGSDALIGGVGADKLDGNAGDDTLEGGDGSDTLIGGVGADKLDGNTGDDTLEGGDGPDTLTGASGSDKLSGNEGDDALDGGDGSDTLMGGTGYDKYRVNDGDLIQDQDGLGSVDFGDTLLSGGKKLAGNIYLDKKSGTYFYKGGSTLIVYRPELNSKITITGWENGRLGITLDDSGDAGHPNGPVIDPRVNDSFNESRRSASPLVIDMANDGFDVVQFSQSNVLFDYDADNIKTKSSWFTDDDVMLVRDINGNSQVDSGRELFGNNTLLRSGTLASDGYEALADLDANGDGKINQAGGELALLQAWKDLNANGATDSGELFSLSALGITEIKLAKTAFSTTLPDGTRLDGTGTVTVNGQIRKFTDIWFSEQPFVREFTAPASIDPDGSVASLPQITGSGTVRDLREAATLSPALKSLLTQFAATSTAEGQRQLIDPILAAWAATSDMTTLSKWEASGHQVSLSLYNGADSATWKSKISILEAFTGQNYAPLSSTGATVVSTGPNRQGLLNNAYSLLFSCVYAQLVTQTRLKPYLDTLEISIEGNDIYFDTSGLDRKLNAAKLADPTSAINDLCDLMKYSSGILIAIGYDALGKIQTWMDESPIGSQVRTVIAANGVLSTPPASGTTEQDIFLGQSANDSFSGGEGSDFISGAAGNDSIGGGAGADSISGGLGNDNLSGGTESDILSGGDGNDWLTGDDGDDTLNGGAGNDYMRGGLGSDVYIFDAGSGQDTVNVSDGALGATDIISFGSGIAVPGLTLTRKGDDLRVGFNASSDGLLLPSYFNLISEGPRLKFDNGTSWSEADISAKLLTFSASDDSLVGYTTNDTIQGGAGNDSIYGEEGNDLLSGGTGNDFLYGDIGDDTIDGGPGRDTLNGGANFIQSGSDTFLFGAGDGIDAISGVDDTDKIVFKAGVKATDVSVVSDRLNLLLNLNTTGDQIKVWSYPWNEDAAHGFEIRFIDDPSIVWSKADIRAKQLIGSITGDSIIGYSSSDSIVGGAGNDTIQGGAGNDRIIADQGNDSLMGEIGDDTLDGGKGNDSLYGGTGNFLSANSGLGNDTYLFGKGDGTDYIFDNDSTASNSDSIVFKAGVTPNDVTALIGSGGDLLLALDATGDKLIVSGFFGSDATNGCQIEEIHFSDVPNVVWKVADIKARALLTPVAGNTITGTAFADRIYAGPGNNFVESGAGNDVVDGGDGQDHLYGDSGNDSIKGDSGNDWLSGGDGDDTLDGGQGTDSLYGGSHDGFQSQEDLGNDTYLFGKGDGIDTIRDTDSTVGNADTIIFKAGVSESDVTVKRDGDSLLLNLAASGDQLKVSLYFSQSKYDDSHIEEIRFVDAPSVVWHVSDIEAKSLIGSDLNDTITGYLSAAIINSGPGNDIVYSGGGNDLISGGPGIDLLYGQAGDDTLDGGTGDDSLYGGSDLYWPHLVQADIGNDTYLFGFGDGNDVIYDNYSSPGNSDKIVFKAGVPLTAVTAFREVDALVLKLDNTNAQLRVEGYFGGGGTNGFQIEEISFLDSPASVWTVSDITSLSTAPTLQVSNSTSRTVGTETNDRMLGSSGNDTLTALAGNDFLFAGAGNDSLLGGDGNDWLYGEDGNDTLDGGTGNDTLVGGSGNDTYVVDSASDVVIEQANGGKDQIKSSITLTAPDNVESIILMGSANLNATGRAKDSTGLIGNNGNNQLTGGSGTDVLAGGFGIDTLIGGAGGDFYRVIDDRVQIVEQAADDGVDVISSFTEQLTMADNVEYLFLITDVATTAFGNNQENWMYAKAWDAWFEGKDGDDHLFGNKGNDVLIGGLGDDELVGGAGNDLYTFQLGDGFDTLTDTDATAGNTDTLDLQGIQANQLWLSKVNDDLKIQVLGRNEGVVIANWYLGSSNQVERMTVGTKTLSNSKVSALVQTMSTMTQPATSVANLSSADQTRLQTALTAAWQG